MQGMNGEVIIERPVPGRPHEGKVLALVLAHADDGENGTVAKLINEGYTGYLIRTTNDEKDSADLTVAETVAANERDAEAVARVLGLRQVFHLGYRNHRMDDESRNEMRMRLVFLFRLLKVDTVLTWDPWGHYEENPDHYVTAQMVEAACWMAGGRLDFPEHFAAGLEPHAVTEKYYYARGPQLINRVVDISRTMEEKIDAYVASRTMMKNGLSRLRRRLAARNLRLPELDGDEESAVRAYVDLVWRPVDAAKGRKYGLAYAEEFHYIGPGADPELEAHIQRNAVPLR